MSPGRFAFVLSSAVHVAVLPLIGGAWMTREKEPPAVVEVSLAWMPPPAVEDAPPAPAVTPASVPAAAPPLTPQTATAVKPPPPAPAARRHLHAVADAAPAPVPAKAVAAQPSPVAVPEAGAPPASAPIPAAVADLPPPPTKGEVLARYSRELLDRLERHKVYPILSQRRGEEGTITVRLTVAEDGRLLKVEPAGEGPGRLVEASLAAVQAAAPFPPLPAELGSREAVFNLPITYRLH